MEAICLKRRGHASPNAQQRREMLDKKWLDRHIAERREQKLAKSTSRSCSRRADTCCIAEFSLRHH
jgi:hypothetical protein